MGCKCGKNKITLLDQIKKIEDRKNKLIELNKANPTDARIKQELDIIDRHKFALEKHKEIQDLAKIQKEKEQRAIEKATGITEKKRMTRGERIEARRLRIIARSRRVAARNKALQEINRKQEEINKNYIQNLNI